MSIVTPVPEDPNEKAAKRWHRRQELQAVLTSLGMVFKGLVDDNQPEEIRSKVGVAMAVVGEAMELLSATPKPRVRTKRKPHLWDK